MIELVAQFIEELSGFTGDVIIGRSNFYQNNSSNRLIIVDYDLHQNLGNTYKYDKLNETGTYSKLFNTNVKLDIYGDNAYSDIMTISSLIRSEKASQISEALDISVYNVGTIQHVATTKDEYYKSRYSTTFNVVSSFEASTPELRIETAQFNI